MENNSVIQIAKNTKHINVNDDGKKYLVNSRDCASSPSKCQNAMPTYQPLPSTSSLSPRSSSFNSKILSLHSPIKLSPHKHTPEYSDRFIPLREPDNWNLRLNMLNNDSNSPTKTLKDLNSTTCPSDLFKNGLAYQCLLKNELLGADIEDINEYKQLEERKILTPLVNRNVFRVCI